MNKIKDTHLACPLCYIDGKQINPLFATDETVKSGYCECPQCGKIRLDKILPFESLFSEYKEAIKKEIEKEQAKN